MAKNFDVQDNAKLTFEMQKYKRINICFPFLEKRLLPQFYGFFYR